MKLPAIFMCVYICLVNLLLCKNEIEKNNFDKELNNYNTVYRGRRLQEGNGNVCEEEKIKISLEKTKVEKNLQHCVETNQKELEKHKKNVEDLKLKVLGCNQKKDELEAKLKQFNEHGGGNGGSGGVRDSNDSEKNELKNKIKKLEEKLKERSSSRSGGKGGENYLISYEIFTNYVWKIYKVYKTAYIVLTDMKSVTNLKEQAVIYKNIFLKKLKESGHVVYETCILGGQLIQANQYTNKVLSFFKGIVTNKYVILIKDNLEEIGQGVKGPLFELIMSYKPKLYDVRDNAKRKFYFVSNRLQKNSELWLKYLYSVNPEIEGIIPYELHDQIILIIFLTIVNLFILYIIFYFFFVTFRFVKGVICFCLRTVWGIIAWVFKTIFFTVTLPIRPCMRKKQNKHRKVYKTHKDDNFNTPDRGQYQQSDFKKSNKEPYVKHRRGRVVR